MGSSITLDIAPRQTIGKQVKQLREQGFIPGVIYGPDYNEPVSVQVEWAALRPVLSQAGGTHLIDLLLEGKTVSVLVRDVQRHPVRQDVLHIDFHAVDINSPIRIRVPVVVPNQEATAKRLQARIFQPLNQIEIECLPGDIPSHISVDMSVLSRAGKHLTVGKLPALKGVTYLADEDLVVVRTVALATLAEEEEEDLSAEAMSADSVEVIHKGKEEEEDF